MPLQQLQQKIDNGEHIPEMSDVNNITLQANKSEYYSIPMVSNNDTFIFTALHILSTISNWRINIYFYYIDNTNRLKLSSQTALRPLGATVFTLDARESVQYYVEFRSTTDITDIALTMETKDYKLIKLLQSRQYFGYESDNVNLKVTRNRPETPCDIPLFYDFLEGELPEGLRMNAVGRIEGVICNLDEMIRTKDKSPSFNWFFTQQESQDVYPIGIVFRFKVRVRMADYKKGDDTSDFEEDWFCIRVHNNWSLDKAKFIENIQKVAIKETHCPPLEVIPVFCCNNDGEQAQITEEVIFKKIEFNPCICPTEEKVLSDEDIIREIKLNRAVPRMELCRACQDPTKPLEMETIVLQNDFFTPEDIVKYYKAHIGKTFNLNMARLSSSPLFQELLRFIDADEFTADNQLSLIEMRIEKGHIITLIKFADETPLDYTARIMENEKNLLNQSMDMEINAFFGYYCRF